MFVSQKKDEIIKVLNQELKRLRSQFQEVNERHHRVVEENCKLRKALEAYREFESEMNNMTGDFLKMHEFINSCRSV